MLILLSGDTYSKISTVFNIAGMSFGSETFYHKNVTPNLNKVVQRVTDEFITKCK